MADTAQTGRKGRPDPKSGKGISLPGRAGDPQARASVLSKLKKGCGECKDYRSTRDGGVRGFGGGPKNIDEAGKVYDTA